MSRFAKPGECCASSPGRICSTYGFVEADDIGKGTIDVIVTEGFAGNIALKAAEGTAHQMASYLRSAMSRSWRAKLGYVFARPAFRRCAKRWIRVKSNGGVFLGLNGIVIKSHGGTNDGGVRGGHRYRI